MAIWGDEGGAGKRGRLFKSPLGGSLHFVVADAAVKGEGRRSKPHPVPVSPQKRSCHVQTNSDIRGILSVTRGLRDDKPTVQVPFNRDLSDISHGESLPRIDTPTSPLGSVPPFQALLRICLRKYAPILDSIDRWRCTLGHIGWY